MSIYELKWLLRRNIMSEYLCMVAILSATSRITLVYHIFLLIVVVRVALLFHYVKSVYTQEVCLERGSTWWNKESTLTTTIRCLSINRQRSSQTRCKFNYYLTCVRSEWTISALFSSFNEYRIIIPCVMNNQIL